MSSRFKNKVALVTGASLGIGRAAALAFGKAGAKVVVNYRSSKDEAEAVVSQIQAHGSQAIAVEADVSCYESVEKLIETSVDEFGQLDIAVSNAAYSDREVFHEADLDGFRRTIDVTMWGAFNLLRTASLQMIKQGHASPTAVDVQATSPTQPDTSANQKATKGGVIVFVSSPHAFIAVPKAMAYNMSKAAIEHMAKTAAIELAEHRIRVNSIQPGWTDTPGERKFASEQTLQKAGAGIPLGRLGTPEEMAESILFLSDPGNDYMTGATLLVDGGISLPWWANRGSAAPG